MVQINFARREVSCKLVYYGPGMCGKTTNLQKVFEKAPDNSKGNLTSIATEGDRTLFFDFLPIDLGEVAGMRTKFQLYTVPGQVYYASTRKLVLQGADGVVFVADSQPAKLQENLESIKDLEDNLKANGIDIEKLPWVIQWNKRDVPNALPVAELEEKVNRRKVPTTEAIAYKGEGVMPTLKLIAKLVLDKMNKEYGRPGARASVPPPAAAAP
ncbi:MAG: GTPase domain-containing protein, partial [Planctomycetes bacterium]|nr:GTPase domain-containing protein [Planctomycetota bacterium]